MAITAVKVGKIARTALALLMRELVVARTVWTDAVDGADFDGALDDTVTVRMRGRVPANVRVLRAGTPLSNSTIVEFPVPVQLTQDVYQSVPVSDEELELDISDFAVQILGPQTEAVAIGIEDEIIDAIQAATFPAAHVVEFDGTAPSETFNRARRLLNEANVPKGNRTALVGTQIEEQLLNDPKFVDADKRGPDRANDAFSEAVIGKTYGFTVVGSNGIGPSEAFCYHKSAFIAATRAPRKPDGATFGQGVSFQGLALRWLKDYDYANTTDRSLVNTWLGTAVVTDPDDPANPASPRSLTRAVKIVDLVT